MRSTIGHAALLMASIALTMLAMLASVAIASNTTLTISGGDWSMGTSTSYCGVYWPNMDFYCETAR